MVDMSGVNFDFLPGDDKRVHIAYPLGMAADNIRDAAKDGENWDTFISEKYEDSMSALSSLYGIEKDGPKKDAIESLYKSSLIAYYEASRSNHVLSFDQVQSGIDKAYDNLKPYISGSAFGR